MTATELVQREGFCNSCRLPLGKEFGKHEMMDSFNTLLHLFPECAIGIYEGKKPVTSFYCTKCALSHEKLNSKIYNHYVSIALQQEMMVEITRDINANITGVEFKEVEPSGQDEGIGTSLDLRTVQV